MRGAIISTLWNGYRLCASYAVDAGADHERRERVAQVVEGALEPVHPAERLEPAREARGVEAAAA